jgi:glycosyltransferase involved in cell wall biosynthesis
MAARTSQGATPLVSVLVATHNAETTLQQAVRSVLRQTVSELEVLVVDDGSSDGTPALLAAVDDPRLTVITNDANLGLARSLNVGLAHARGRYVARLDADDVAMRDRLELQLAALRERPGLAVLGTAVMEIDGDGAPGVLHVPPTGDAGVRWHALFSSPFFHPTVIVDRHALERHELRYDEQLAESEDYDLWARLLELEPGDNLAEPLVLRRVHPGQASKRRPELQRSIQRAVALRTIARAAPELGETDAALAWQLGALGVVGQEGADRAVHAFLELVAAFATRHPAGRRIIARSAARRLAVIARQEPAVWRQVLRLDPLFPVSVLRERRARSRVAAAARPAARRWQAGLVRADVTAPVRVVVVSPEPTPYRAPLFDRVAERAELELTVVYQAHTVAGRAWAVELRHRAVFLRGVRIPGVRRLLRHDYPVTPGVVRALRGASPDVVVVSGWSTFASQAAVAWCRRHGVPYLLLVSSHDDEPRAGWRRRPREALVGRIIDGASGALVLGTLSRRGLEVRGLDPARIGVFANTIDVASWTARAAGLSVRRVEIRAELDVAPHEVVVLSVARLSPEKELDDLVRAVAEAGTELALVVAGSGPERVALEGLARELGVRLLLVGDVGAERLAELYVAADVFALLSSREPWGVVVNEAAASGLPLLLSDRVGAAPDLLRDGENGDLVAVGDVAAASVALRRLVADPAWRNRAGATSRLVMNDWGYDPSVDAFVERVRDAADR